MTTLVLDAGALIALDRNDRSVWATLRNAPDDSVQVSVPAGVIAQTWRDERRQALLVRARAHCDEVPLDGPLARADCRVLARPSSSPTAGRGTVRVPDGDLADASVGAIGGW